MMYEAQRVTRVHTVYVVSGGKTTNGTDPSGCPRTPDRSGLTGHEGHFSVTQMRGIDIHCELVSGDTAISR